MKARTILLLEDEPLIAEDLQFFLEKLGCRVLCPLDFGAALDGCGEVSPDLILLNFHQNEPPSGPERAEMLQKKYRSRAMFITGARTQDIENAANAFPGLTVLHKPFTHGQLRTALAEFM